MWASEDCPRVNEALESVEREAVFHSNLAPEKYDVALRKLGFRP